MPARQGVIVDRHRAIGRTPDSETQPGQRLQQDLEAGVRSRNDDKAKITGQFRQASNKGPAGCRAIPGEVNADPMAESDQ